MQPFLEFLVLEGAVFYLAILGDAYMTNHLVRRYGPEVEANPRVREMYVAGNLKWSWATVFLIAPLYAFLGWLGLTELLPYFPFMIAGFGAILPLLAVVNLALGGVVFYRMKRPK